MVHPLMRYYGTNNRINSVFTLKIKKKQQRKKMKEKKSKHFARCKFLEKTSFHNAKIESLYPIPFDFDNVTHKK